MSGSPFDDHVAGLPEPQREALERIRRRVNELVPDAEEAMSYGMPAFKLRGRPLLGVRAGKGHLSVFPFSPAAVEAARAQLTGFDLSKGTVRFTPEKPLPEAALRALLQARVREIEAA